jgi:hypothetical protein
MWPQDFRACCIFQILLPTHNWKTKAGPFVWVGQCNPDAHGMFCPVGQGQRTPDELVSLEGEAELLGMDVQQLASLIGTRGMMQGDW